MNSKTTITEISKHIWIKRWAQLCTLISASYWGPQYNEIVRTTLDVGFSQTLFIQKRGVISCFMRKMN